MVPMENVYSKGVPFQPFWGLTHKMSTTPNGKTLNPKEIKVQESYFLHPFDVEKFAEFNGEIIFLIRPKTKNWIQGRIQACEKH